MSNILKSLAFYLCSSLCLLAQEEGSINQIIDMNNNSNELLIKNIKEVEFLDTSLVDSNKFIEYIIDNAIKQNPNVLSKINAYMSSQDAEKTAFWSYFPTPSITFEYDDKGNFTKVASIQQPLYAGGRIDAEYEKAKIQTKNAKTTLEETKYNIALSIAEAINSLIMYNGRTKAYESYISSLNEYKDMMDRRIENGISPDSEAYLIDSRLSQAITEYQQTKISQEKTLLTLEQLTGKKLSIENFDKILPQNVTELEIYNNYNKNSTEFLDDVIKYNPSLNKYDYQIEIMKSELEIKKSTLLPKLYAKADKKLYDDKEYQDSSRVYMGVEYSMGAGLSALSSIDSAKANILVAQNDKNSYELELKFKAQTEYKNYVLTKEKYSEYLKNIENTKKTIESYKRLFIAGKKSWLDLLNSNKELNSIQLSLSDIQAYLNIAPIKLRIYANELDWQRNINDK